MVLIDNRPWRAATQPQQQTRALAFGVGRRSRVPSLNSEAGC